MLDPVSASSNIHSLDCLRVHIISPILAGPSAHLTSCFTQSPCPSLPLYHHLARHHSRYPPPPPAPSPSFTALPATQYAHPQPTLPTTQLNTLKTARNNPAHLTPDVVSCHYVAPLSWAPARVWCATGVHLSRQPFPSPFVPYTTCTFANSPSNQCTWSKKKILKRSNEEQSICADEIIED